MPLWALRLRDFDILNIYYDEFKIEKMVKFETLIVPRGLIKVTYIHRQTDGQTELLPELLSGAKNRSGKG